MELVITEKAEDNSVKFRCDLCDYNPYQAWCKGNTARFHAALMKHKQTARHREAEAFARGEQPVSISKGGVISADVPHPPTQPYYISKLENMIDKLEQRIDALNSAYEPSEASSEYNLNYLGSLVGDFRHPESFGKIVKSGELGTRGSADIESRQSPVSTDFGSLVGDFRHPESFGKIVKSGELGTGRGDVLYAYHFKELEVEALRNYGDRSSITNMNALGAVCRLLSWVEVYERDEGRRERSLAFLKKTRLMMEKLEAMKKEGWRIDDDDFNAIGERLDDILEYDFTVYK
jgi:hypothetical protein